MRKVVSVLVCLISTQLCALPFVPQPLHNCGNTCFFNAAVQNLFNLVGFNNKVLQIEGSPLPMPVKLYRDAYYTAIGRGLSPNMDTLARRYITTIFGPDAVMVYDEISGEPLLYNQQDAAEVVTRLSLVSDLLDVPLRSATELVLEGYLYTPRLAKAFVTKTEQQVALLRMLYNSSRRMILKKDVQDDQKVVQELETLAQRYQRLLEDHATPMPWADVVAEGWQPVNLRQGLVVQKMRRNIATESVPSLQVEIPSKKLATLQGCLANYFSEPKPLNLSNLVYYQKGRKKLYYAMPLYKKNYIMLASNYCIIHLKRFNFDATSHVALEKNKALVIVPPLLNLGDCYEVKQQDVFELIGACIHSGDSLETGHYYAYVKNQNDEQQQWFKCDDENIVSYGESDYTKIPLAVRVDVNKGAYMLFYKRRGYNPPPLVTLYALQHDLDVLVTLCK